MSGKTSYGSRSRSKIHCNAGGAEKERVDQKAEKNKRLKYLSSDTFHESKQKRETSLEIDCERL